MVIRLGCRSGWSGLMLERGGRVCEPKCGLTSRAFTKLGKTTQPSENSPLSIIQPALAK